MADMTIFELPDSGTPELLAPEARASIVEFGASLTETYDKIFPEGTRIDVAFGVPTAVQSTVIDGIGLGVSVLFGEPFAGPVVSFTTPEITNVQPAAGSQLSTTQSWQFDAEGTIAELIVWVAYADLSVVEVVYDGSGFTPNFNGASIATDLGGGDVRLLIKRNAGWPSAPRFFVRARNTDGGVNV